jgi:hypothetical protein
MTVIKHSVWTSTGDDFVRGGLRIRRLRDRTGWLLVIDPEGDMHLAEIAPKLRSGIRFAKLSQAKRRGNDIEVAHLRTMKARTNAVVGVLAMAMVYLLPASMNSAIEYAAWVAALGIAAESLLRACEAAFWDEWGWFGPARRYITATRLDRFIDRRLVAPGADSDESPDLLVVVDG